MPATIKFRAYSEKYGKMVYPNDPEYRIEIGNDDVHRVWKGEGDDEGVVVMRFTGLFDKSGRDIYEGDIIEYHTSERRGRSTDEWEPDLKQCVVAYEGNYYCNVAPFNKITNVLSVIGNIHENPELIEN